MNGINIVLKNNAGFLLIAILSVGILTEISLITNASALNYYFNCITKKVNNGEQFEMQEAFLCYDNVFKGAQKYANEPYQNPDLTKLDSLKPVADPKTGDDKTEAPIIKPNLQENESEKSNGNPVAENESEKSNGNPVAENESEKSNGNPVAGDKVDKDTQSEKSGSDAKSSQEIKEIPLDGNADNAHSSSNPANYVNKEPNNEYLPSLGSNVGNKGNSQFYNSFDLPFTAVIPQ